MYRNLVRRPSPVGITQLNFSHACIPTHRDFGIPEARFTESTKVTGEDGH